MVVLFSGSTLARENLALVRRIALTRLQHDDAKLGIQSKRLKAGWDERYSAKLLFEAPKIAPQKNASKNLNITRCSTFQAVINPAS